MIRPIVDQTEIAEAFAAFSQIAAEGSQQVECIIGYQGGSETAALLWHPDKNIWIMLEPERLDNRFWCAFGTESPITNSMVSITCEINPPRAGYNRQIAGLFIIDSAGAVHLAHSGKIGGGRPGIGKAAFMDSRNQNDVVPVHFPDGRESNYIVIGRVDAPDFLDELAGFVHAVADFKRGVEN